MAQLRSLENWGKHASQMRAVVPPPTAKPLPQVAKIFDASDQRGYSGRQLASLNDSSVGAKAARSATPDPSVIAHSRHQVLYACPVVVDASTQTEKASFHPFVGGGGETPGAEAGLMVPSGGRHGSRRGSLGTALVGEAEAVRRDGIVHESDHNARRRKSLVKLLSMPADEISALGAIEDTLRKVTDDTYDLLGEMPASPHVSMMENSRNTSQSRERAGADVPRTRPTAPVFCVEMPEQHDPYAQIAGVVRGVDSARAQLDSSWCDQRLNQLIADAPADWVHDLRSLALAVDSAKSWLDATRDALVTTVTETVRALRHDERAAVRAEKVAREALAEAKEEVGYVSAAIQKLGIVPTVNGIPAPSAGELCMVHLDVPFADLLWRRNAQVAKSALKMFTDATRLLAKEYSGYEAVNQGSEILLIFTAARPAIDFALRLQMHLLHEPWPPQLAAWRETFADDRMLFRGLRARIGVHTGYAEPEFHSRIRRLVYDGETSLTTAALCGVAHPGTIAVSGAAITLLGPTSFSELATRGGACGQALGLQLLPTGESVSAVLLVPGALRGRLNACAAAVQVYLDDEVRRQEASTNLGAVKEDPPLAPPKLTSTPATALVPKEINGTSSFVARCVATASHCSSIVHRSESILASRDLHLTRGETFGKRHVQAVLCIKVSRSDELYAADPDLFLHSMKQLLALVEASVAVAGGVVVGSFVDTLIVRFDGTDAGVTAVAARWGVRCQLSAMDVQWRASFSDLPGAATVYSGGRRVFCGPRLKMGVTDVVASATSEDPVLDAVRRALGLALYALEGETVVSGVDADQFDAAEVITQSAAVSNLVPNPHRGAAATAAANKVLVLIPSVVPQRVHPVAIRDEPRWAAVAWPASPLDEIASEALESARARLNAIEGVMRHCRETLWHPKAAAGAKPPPSSDVTFVAVDFVATALGQTSESHKYGTPTAASTATVLRSGGEAQRFAAQLAIFLDMARRLAILHAGYELSAWSDAYIVAFDNPVRAAVFAVQLAEEVREREWAAGADVDTAATAAAAGVVTLRRRSSARLDVGAASSAATSEARSRRSSHSSTSTADGNGDGREAYTVHIGVVAGTARAAVSPTTHRTCFFGSYLHKAVHLAALAPAGRIFMDGSTLLRVQAELPTTISTGHQGERYLPGDTKDRPTSIFDLWTSGGGRAPTTNIPPQPSSLLHWAAVRLDSVVVEYALPTSGAKANLAALPVEAPVMEASHSFQPPAADIPPALVSPLAALLVRNASLLLLPSEDFKRASLRCDWLASISAVLDAVPMTDSTPIELVELQLPTADQVTEALDLEAAAAASSANDKNAAGAADDETYKMKRRKSRILRLPAGGLGMLAAATAGGEAAGLSSAEVTKMQRTIEALTQDKATAAAEVNRLVDFLGEVLTHIRNYVSVIAEDDKALSITLPTEEEMTKRFVAIVKERGPACIFNDVEEKKRSAVDRVFAAILTLAPTGRAVATATVELGLRSAAGQVAKFQQGIIRCTRRFVALRRSASIVAGGGGSFVSQQSSDQSQTQSAAAGAAGGRAVSMLRSRAKSVVERRRSTTLAEGGGGGGTRRASQTSPVADPLDIDDNGGSVKSATSEVLSSFVAFA